MGAGRKRARQWERTRYRVSFAWLRHWEGMQWLVGGLGAWRDDQIFVLRKALWLWWSGWLSFREERRLLFRFVGGLNRGKDGEDGEEGWIETC